MVYVVYTIKGERQELDSIHGDEGSAYVKIERLAKQGKQVAGPYPFVVSRHKRP